MTIAVPATPALMSAATRAPARIRRVEIFRNIAEAAPCWDALEREGALMTLPRVEEETVLKRRH